MNDKNGIAWPRRPAFREALARIVITASLGLTMSACTGWPGPYGSGGHLSENPFDQAVLAGIESETAEEARRRLLQRFPAGSQTGPVRRYLESIGASCVRRSIGPLVCQYSQYWFWANRGMFGDVWREYRHHDFTIRLSPGQGPVREVTVCRVLTSEVQEGPIFGPANKPRESKFKTCP